MKLGGQMQPLEILNHLSTNAEAVFTQLCAEGIVSGSFRDVSWGYKGHRLLFSEIGSGRTTKNSKSNLSDVAEKIARCYTVRNILDKSSPSLVICRLNSFRWLALTIANKICKHYCNRIPSGMQPYKFCEILKQPDIFCQRSRLPFHRKNNTLEAWYWKSNTLNARHNLSRTQVKKRSAFRGEHSPGNISSPFFAKSKSDARASYWIRSNSPRVTMLRNGFRIACRWGM